MDKELTYNDISLIPNRCIVQSRSDCNTSVTLGKFTFNLPIIPANMKAVVNEKTCEYLASKNIFHIMHRFQDKSNPIINPTLQFIKDMHSQHYIASISIGVNSSDYALINKMKSENIKPEFITIDIAHGWCDKMEVMVKYIKDLFGDDIFIIAGNVCTTDAVKDLDRWGADAIKIGIASGKSCITRLKTGFHRPMVNTIAECFYATNKPIIADGGVEQHGDIAKAICLGSHMVMAGSLFAGYDQSAGEIIEIEDRLYKEYYGSASAKNKGEYKHVEGKKILVPYKGNMDNLITELQEDLRSSISYAGGDTLDSLRDVEYIKVG